MKEQLLSEISEFLQKGRKKQVVAKVQEALDNGVDAKSILQDGLLAGMAILGVEFRENRVYVPDVLVAARAMNEGAALLETYLAEEGVTATGKAIIGTVEGDMHDIGKNLVIMMLKGVGFDVVDIGIDVPAQNFIDAAEEHNADIVCISALLTTTMPRCPEIIDLFKAQGVRDKYIIMVGGAPVNQPFATEIGADYYAKDAATAADIAKAAVAKKRGQ